MSQQQQIPRERLDEAIEAGFDEKHATKLWVSFTLYDEDKSGYIDERELIKVMQAFGQNPKQHSIRKMLEEADTSGDGKVDFREFCKIAQQKHKAKEQKKQQLRDAFSVFDEDGSGYLNRRELKKNLTSMGMDKLTAAEVEELMDIADLDNDGRLSIEEFVYYFTMNVNDMKEQINGH